MALVVIFWIGHQSITKPAGLYKVKAFCTSREIINKKKRQITERKKYLQIISDKGLTSKVYKELKKKKTLQIKPKYLNKWAKVLSRCFSEKDKYNWSVWKSA